MRQLTLASGRTIMLNEEQEEALTRLETWAESESYFFLLSGYAGTGKTTLIKEFITYVKQEYGSSVAISAPTHKAKKVIVEATGLPGFTVQKLLGLGLDVDISNFDPAKPEFKVRYIPLMPDYEYVIIDEGSMINKQLFHFIVKTAFKHSVKVVFMADKAQLPPVNEELSEIFTSPEIKDKYQLTKVERQAGDNPLMLVYDAIRSNLRSAKDMFPKETHMTEEGEGVSFLNSTNFTESALISYTSEEFDEDAGHCKVLAWTNQEVSIWNRTIRKHRMEKLYPDGRIGAVMPGDLLMAYATREGYIVNSSEYIIQSASLSTIEIEYPNLRNFAEKFVKKIRYISALSKDVDTGAQIELRILNPWDKAAISDWIEVYQAFTGKAKKFPKAWADYFSFRGKILLLQDVQTPYSVVKKDIDFGYALTVHRSQGSTYNEVFIVDSDINKNRRTTERNQLKYVAFSRPRKRAYVLSN